MAIFKYTSMIEKILLHPTPAVQYDHQKSINPINQIHNECLNIMWSQYDEWFAGKTGNDRNSTDSTHLFNLCDSQKSISPMDQIKMGVYTKYAVNLMNDLLGEYS